MHFHRVLERDILNYPAEILSLLIHFRGHERQQRPVSILNQTYGCFMSGDSDSVFDSPVKTSSSINVEKLGLLQLLHTVSIVSEGGGGNIVTENVSV